MNFTKELFDLYINSDEEDNVALAEDCGYERFADFEEDIMIWAVNNVEKEKVMSIYSMDENEYAESRKAWAYRKTEEEW
jgi:hypothetical protein